MGERVTNKAYFHKVREILSSADRTVRDYFEGHIQRFEMTVTMLRQNLPIEIIESVFDVGTGFPFVSLHYKWEYDAEVTFACMEQPNLLPSGTTAIRLNLNRCDERDPIRRDLVICTECLEHLPRRHDVVLDWLCSCADRALFISVPMFGQGAADHNVDLPMDFNKTYQEHWKEYSPDTIDELLDRVKGNGFTVADMRSIQTTHYQADMRHILFVKETT